MHLGDGMVHPQLSSALLLEMDTDGDGEVTEEELVEAFLRQVGGVV